MQDRIGGQMVVISEVQGRAGEGEIDGDRFQREGPAASQRRRASPRALT